jgi:hypothetical protein
MAGNQFYHELLAAGVEAAALDYILEAFLVHAASLMRYLKTNMTETRYAENKQRAIIPISFLFESKKALALSK